MAGTCKECKWWKRAAGNWPSPDPKHSVCDKVDGGTTVAPNGFSIDATADDDTNLCAFLVTGPDFGCNQFEPKVPG